MKGIIGLVISLVFLATGNGFSQNVSFELSEKKFVLHEGKQAYEFQVLIASQQSRRLHSGQLYFNYQDELLGQNLISKSSVFTGVGVNDILLTEESGNPLFKGFVLNDNTGNRFSFSWQNNFSCDALGVKSVIGVDRKVLTTFRILFPSGINTDGLDLNKLICFESGELFDDQLFDCPGTAINQVIKDAFYCTDRDTIAPLSTISSSTPKVVREERVILSWTGTDNIGGSGIASYELYVSDNGSPFTLLAADFNDTSYVFTGNPFNTYSFYTIAIDQQGNREKQKASGDVSVFFDSELGVVSNSLGTPIEASPNPMTESFTLRFAEQVEQVEVHITNIYGETVLKENFGNTAAEIITIPGASGVYFVKVISGIDKSALFKILKI